MTADRVSANATRLSVGQPTSSRSDFLGNLKLEDREALVRLVQRRNYDKGEPVFRPGGPGANVYFLEAGRVKIYQPSGSSRDVLLWFCLVGEVFGLAEVAWGGRGRVVGAVACERSTVLAVSQENFRAFLVSRPQVALLCMEVLSSRLRGLSDVLVNLASDEVDTRIAKLILRLGARYGRREDGVMHLDIPLTHQEIADMVGATRQTVTTVLSRLRRRGVLSIDTHRIQIESEELLSGLAQE